MNITKAHVVDHLLTIDFQLDGMTDYRRVVEAVKEQFNVALSNKACWAVINELKQQDLAVLDFD